MFSRFCRNCIGFGTGVLTESCDWALFLAFQFLILGRLGFAGLWGCGAGGLGLRPALGLGLGLDWNLVGISSHTFNENSKLSKMQFEAKFTQFLFILRFRALGFKGISKSTRQHLQNQAANRLKPRA